MNFCAQPRIILTLLMVRLQNQISISSKDIQHSSSNMWFLSFSLKHKSNGVCILLRNKNNEFSRIVPSICTYFDVIGSKTVFILLLLEKWLIQCRYYMYNAWKSHDSREFKKLQEKDENDILRELRNCHFIASTIYLLKIFYD